MNNTNKILLSVLSFAASAVIGFFGTGLIKDYVSKASHSDTSLSSSGGSGSSMHSEVRPTSGGKIAPPSETPVIPSDGSVQLDSTSSISTSVKILGISTPVYDDNTMTYSFDVTASGMGLNYVLSDEKGTLVLSQASPHFTVKGTSSGSYSLYVQDVNGNRTESQTISGCYYKVRKITAEELERVLNSKESDNAYKADFKNRVSPSCRYEFRERNLDEGDAPASYSDIIMRLKYNTWSSVSVISISYDSMNRMSKAIIKVNY